MLNKQNCTKRTYMMIINILYIIENYDYKCSQNFKFCLRILRNHFFGIGRVKYF